MPDNNILDKEKYLEGIMGGIHTISELIKPTYGGKGQNVVLESKLYPYHQVVNDCETIIQAVQLKDKGQKIGADFLKEISSKQDKLLGNGRKTTILMTDKLLQEANKYQTDKNKLKKELDDLIPFIESEIDKQTTQISVDQVESVATTASENPDTGKLLQEIYQKIGKNGIIQPESSNTFQTSYKFIDGVRFERTGMLSAFMVHDEQAKKDKVKETKAIYENPTILVTKKKIVNSDDINPILKSLSTAEKTNLVIFTQDMDSNIASSLINIHTAGGYNDIYGGFHTMNILIIKAPVLWKDYVFEDFAKCTGATIVEDATGVNYKNLALQHLGTCDKIEVDNDETLIWGAKDISEHIASLQEKGDNDSKLRLSWLVNKSAILKLGANSETELSLKRLKTADGIRSSQLALKSGVVRGGGLCLKEVADLLPDTTAGDIMKEVLKTPYNINIENGVVDIPDSVVDASMVVKASVRHAVGIASTVMTASSLVYIPELTPQEIELQIMLGKQNPMNN